MLSRFLPPLITATLTFLWSPLTAAEPASCPETRRVVIAATGDVLLHQSVVGAARSHQDEGGWPRALGGLAAAIDDHELAVVNLETPLSEVVVPPRRGDHPVLGAPAEVASVLAAAGVDLASVANNHAFDQDSQGLATTMTALVDAGIEPVGAGPSLAAALEPRVVRRGELTIAVLAATGPMNQRHRGRGRRHYVPRLRQEEALVEAVASARQAPTNADLVVVLLHWMWDYRRGPRRYERRLARRLIDAGADVLLGAGPHLLHPVDQLPSPRGEAVVAWSLGNLISGMGMRWRPGFRAPPEMHPVSVLPGTRDAAVVHITIELDPEGQVSVGDLRATALWTTNNWLDRGGDEPWRHDIRVIPLTEAAEPTRAARLPAIRQALGPEVTVE